MDLTDFAAAATIVATIIGTTWRVLAKLNSLEMDLLRLRMDLTDYKHRLESLERRHEQH